MARSHPFSSGTTPGTTHPAERRDHHRDHHRKIRTMTGGDHFGDHRGPLRRTLVPGPPSLIGGPGRARSRAPFRATTTAEGACGVPRGTPILPPAHPMDGERTATHVARGIRYDDEIRERAVELAAAQGLRPAVERMRVTHPELQKSTIARWCKAAGVTPLGAEREPTEATRVRQQMWRERRLKLKHQLGELAEEAVARSLREVRGRGGSARNAKDLATTAAIALDKAELLDVHDEPAELEQRSEAIEAKVAAVRGRGLQLLPGGQAEDVA